MLTQEEREIIIKLLEEVKDIPNMYKEKMFTTELDRVDLTKEYKLQYYGNECNYINSSYGVRVNC